MNKNQWKITEKIILGPKRKEFFGFALNEYHWRRVSFSRHFSREAAEKAHYTPFRHEEDPVSADLEPTVIEGRDAFNKWAKECHYRIDWEKKVLIHEEVEDSQS